MRVYHFTEQPYPDAWLPEPNSLRVTIPNALCDPEVASGLLNRYIDEWCLADELGLDIMVNEHHSTTTCLTASCHITLAILARNTRRARLLALGIPLANRPDPLRIAEEMSMIDLISKGRLEMGFVKGVPSEVTSANSVPVRMMDRFWEAHDLIMKAMTTHDGPFNWEGEYFQYRAVNIWPRPYQQPYPSTWVTTLSPGNVRRIAEHGHVLATFLSGMIAKTLFDGYRKVWSETHDAPADVDRFGYLGLCAVGSNPSEAQARAEKVARYLKTYQQISDPFIFTPGYLPPEIIAKKYKAGTADISNLLQVQTRDGRTVDVRHCSVQDLIDADMMFAGTPDQVFQQITRFTDAIGGLGHLMLMMQGAHLGHADVAGSLGLFAAEVLPRLKEWSAARVKQSWS